MDALVFAGLLAVFDHGQFCAAAKEVAREANADVGKPVDPHTRSAGMRVDCAARSVELELRVDLPFSAIPDNWRDRTTLRWNDDYCSDPAWRQAITHHWKVTLLVASSAGEHFAVSADCH